MTRIPDALRDAPYREPRLPPLPPRPPLVWLLVAALGCGLLATYTTKKLSKMARLRGEEPGIPQRSMRLEREFRRFNPHHAEYRLVDPDDPAYTSWTIQLSSRQMERTRYGDIVTVRCLDDKRECFVPGSIYINDGNMGFDRGLRVIELAGMLGCLAVVARRLRTWRRSLRIYTPSQ